MRKAVSELVVIVMFLMIAVALIGLVFIFISGFQEQTKTETQQTGETSFMKAGSCLEVISFDDKANNLYVKNCGRQPISNITVLVDKKPIYVDDAAINPNEIKAFAVYSDNKGAHEVKIIGDYVNAMAVVDVKTPATIGFTLSLYPASGSNEVLSIANAAVNTELIYGEAKQVQLSCSKLPLGVTCSFSPSSVAAGESSALAISAANGNGNGVNGTFVINIGGAADGLIKNASFSLLLKNKTVFVSSATYTGDLREGGAGSGLDGANAKCNNLASAAGLTAGGRVFKAWLSNSTDSAADRLTHSSVPYVRIDGVVVADDWADVVDGGLANPINVDEYGIPKGGEYGAFVWTGTNTAGYYSGEDKYACTTDWTCSIYDSSQTGMIGYSGVISSSWTSGSNSRCSSNRALYCFEQ